MQVNHHFAGRNDWLILFYWFGVYVRVVVISKRVFVCHFRKLTIAANRSIKSGLFSLVSDLLRVREQNHNTAIFNDAADADKVNPLYINTITTLEENKDNPLYLKLIEIYHTDDVKEKLLEVYDGHVFPMFEVPLPEVD